MPGYLVKYLLACSETGTELACFGSTKASLQLKLTPYSIHLFSEEVISSL